MEHMVRVHVKTHVSQRVGSIANTGDFQTVGGAFMRMGASLWFVRQERKATHNWNPKHYVPEHYAFTAPPPEHYAPATLRPRSIMPPQHQPLEPHAPSSTLCLRHPSGESPKGQED